MRLSGEEGEKLYCYCVECQFCQYEVMKSCIGCVKSIGVSLSKTLKKKSLGINLCSAVCLYVVHGGLLPPSSEFIGPIFSITMISGLLFARLPKKVPPSIIY